MTEIIQLAPGVELRAFHSSRFKQGALSLQFITPMCRETAGLNALLPAVLLRGTEDAPDLRAITHRLDDLYGAAVGTAVRRVGDYQTTGLYCSCMEDRFALPGDRVLEPMTKLLRELLLEPRMEEGLFCREFVEGEKRNLISTIEAQYNDKRAWADQQLLLRMCGPDPFGIPRLGSVEAVEAITPQSLTAHYRSLLEKAPICLFYVGSFPAREAARLLRPVFEGLPRSPAPLPRQTALSALPGGSGRDALDTAQSHLCLGYTTPITNRDPRFAAMQVLNALFGAGMTSKLFMQVRERLSLCYAIGSAYYGAKGIVTVSAGIDACKEGLAREEIARQLSACQEGEITPLELVSAKETVLSSLRSIHDSPGSIENYYCTAALSGLGMTPEQYRRAVEQVQLEDVVAAAGTLMPHTEYFLEGVAK